MVPNLTRPGRGWISAVLQDCPFEWPDRATAVRALLSAGPHVAAARQVGTEAVRRAVADSLAPFRTGRGGYRQRNRFRSVIASP
jgi:hypothetical protein